MTIADATNPTLPGQDDASGVADMSLMFDFCRATERLTGHMYQALQEHGLSCSQYHVLRVLAAASPEPLTCGALIAGMPKGAPDMTRLVDRLCRSGLLWRRHSENDRRVVIVGLTGAGAELAQRLDGPMQAAVARLFGRLSPGELASLRGALRKLAEPSPGETPSQTPQSCS